MKIVMVNNRYFPAIGGSETLVRKLSRGLVDRGHVVTVLCTDFLEVSGNTRVVDVSPKDEKVTVVRVRGCRLGRDPFTLSLPLIEEARKLSNSHDVIHCFTYGYHTSWGVMLAKKIGLITKPIVFSPHYAPSETIPSWASGLFDATLGRMSISGADRVVLLTERYRDFFLKHGALEEHIEVVPPLIEPAVVIDRRESEQMCRKYGIPADKKIILSLGRIEECKGILFLIDAVDVLRQASQFRGVSPFHCVIAGNGSYRAALERKVRDKGLASYFTFTGSVSDRERALLYSCADVFALLSYSGESYGIVLGEAMQYSVPLLGSNRGAIPSVIQDGRNGFVVEPSDAQSVADRLSNLLRDDVAAEMRKHNREDAERYSEDSIVTKMLAIYESVLRI